MKGGGRSGGASTRTVPLGEKMIALKAYNEMFRCVICFNTMEASIMGCNEGHNICSECHSRWNDCPLCRTAVSVRNRQMEGFRDGLVVTCDCAAAIKSQELHAHRKICEMQTIACPFLAMTNAHQCSDIAPGDLDEHIRRFHPDAAYHTLNLDAVRTDALRFHKDAPVWKEQAFFKIVPSDDLASPTIVLVKTIDGRLRCIVHALVQLGDLCVTLRSYCTAAAGIVVCSSTSCGGETRAIHRLFQRLDEIRVHASYEAAHTASVEVTIYF